MEKEFDIWIQGYAITGNSSGARYIGKSKGKDFNEAIENFRYKEDIINPSWNSNKPENDKYFHRKGDKLPIDRNIDGSYRYGTPSSWACKYFCNEAELTK